MPELTLDQGTIRYLDEGSGPPVVFVHGALVDSRLWEPVIERLRGRFRCIAPDLPLGSHQIPLKPDADLSPHGLARIVSGVIEQLDLRDVTLVGNDTGGALCQLLVVAAPERIGRLVLTDCDAFEDFPPKMFKPLITAAKIPGALRAGLEPMRAKAARRLPMAYGGLLKRPIPDEVMDGWVLRALKDKGIMNDLRRALSGIDSNILLDNTPKLAGFKKPVLFVWSREDKFFKIEHAHRLAKIFPDARVEELDDAYTFVSWDQPDRVAELIGAFASGGGQVAGSVAAGAAV
ncbi:alpha/beta fold hydrolase [Baekduia sp. Peel2402]|uniref:alpha/beta fold hydrolase n=1 Tax=Baekduia sp. Peel2402 TaxID=3458296 RepID=UPI00403E43A6